ncbi:MAG: biotin--[acetyl-CoA-carboxylase] ligase [Hyphomicrobiaceae bacterium]
MQHRVIVFRTIDSTNSEAQRRVSKGELGPVWLRADEQVSGRGRSGRSWVSPIGNLSATLIFQPECQLDNLHQLSLVAGLAAHDTIERALGQGPSSAKPQLKWPNDILIGNRKIGGILVEGASRGCQSVAMVGFGMNLAVTPEVGGRHATCLGDYMASSTPEQFLQELDCALHAWLEVWGRGTRFQDITEAWLLRAHPTGTSLTINTHQGRVSGDFLGLERDGALLLRETKGTVRSFHFGDVAIVKSQRDHDN